MTHSRPVIFFWLPLPSLPLPFSTYVNVRCKLPTPADRCGSANRLHFHTHAPPPAGPSGDTAKHAGCHQPLTQRWSCVCAAQPGSRWSLVQVRGSSRSGFLTDIRSSTKKLILCEKVELSWNITQHKIAKLSQPNKPTKSCSVVALTDWHDCLLVYFLFSVLGSLTKNLLKQLLFLWPFINSLTKAGRRLKF